MKNKEHTVLPVNLSLITQFLFGSFLLASLVGFTWDPTFIRSTPRIHGEPSGEKGVPFAPSVQAMVITQDGELFAGTFGVGVFRSQNGGKSWEPMNVGLTDHFLLCLATNSQGHVYAGTVRGGVFRITAGANTWVRISQGLKRVEVKALLVNAIGVFAGTGRGVYRLNEETLKWNIVTDELDQLLVSSLAMLDDRILLAATAGKGLFRFDVSGATASKWQGEASELVDPKERLHHRFLRIVAIGEQEEIFLGTQDGGIFRSTDQGTSWHTISRTLPNDSIRSIISNQAGLFVGTGRGVYKLDKVARRWKSRNIGLTERSIQTLVNSPSGVMYAGTSSGAFRSEDAGLNWENISEGLGVQTTRSGPYD